MATTYLGIDVGTSATRVAIIDETGRVLRSAAADYPTNSFDGGGSEQDPEAWLMACQQALKRIDIRDLEPRAIGLCGQTPTLVFCDGEGTARHPALTWQDVRATQEAEQLQNMFGDPETLIGTLLPWSASNTPAKIKWLSTHEPGLVSQIHFILQPKDYVGMALTGSPTSDGWSSKGLCNVIDGRPAQSVLQACGWSNRVCPPIDLPWSQRGNVTAAASAKFGLKVGTPVTVGWSDALAEILAAGAFARESGFMFNGTSSIIGAPARNPALRVKGLFYVPTSCAPLTLLYGPTQAGGSALAWGAQLLGCDIEEFISLASRTLEAPTFVPYLNGERAPLWDPVVRGVFADIDSRHGRPEFARAVVLGVIGAARNILELVSDATHKPISEVEVAGRGVGQVSWEALASEGLGLNLRFHHDAELSVRGAAMLAMALDGVDVVEASTRMVDITHEVPSTQSSATTARQGVERFRTATELAIQWRHSYSQQKEH